ncbi:MAG: hypothetical protein IJS54_05200 [Desulfovibrio sp.]|nr:hypothetical protein [Desulfovibrio sp.]
MAGHTKGKSIKKKLLKAQSSGKKPLASIAALATEGARIPREYWEAGCLFYGFADLEWRRLTNDVFPATLRPDKHSHPCYVLASSSLADIVCPCSSKRSKSPYIPEGAILGYSNAVCDRASYVLEAFSYPMAAEETFATSVWFKGFWPPEKLERM